MSKKTIFILIASILILTIGTVTAEINTSTIEGAPTNDGGDGGAMVIDSNGFIHATYTARGLISPTYPYTAYYANQSIRYCNNTVGSWSCIYISDCNLSGFKGPPSIALDSNDNVHITYSVPFYPNGGIYYCNNTNNSLIYMYTHTYIHHTHYFI